MFCLSLNHNYYHLRQYNYARVDKKDKKKIEHDMIIGGNLEIIEEGMKFEYENLLSELVTFIYYRFLTSVQKYTQAGYITRTQTITSSFYEIKSWLVKILALLLFNHNNIKF